MKRYAVILKVAGVVTLSLIFAFLVLEGLYFTAVCVGLGIVCLAFSLYFDQYRSVRRMEQLIANIRHGDLNLSFPGTDGKGMDGRLTTSMNEALIAFRERLYQSVVTDAETAAWQKLISVLTHEIMNSIAPIISLSETITERQVEGRPTESEYRVMQEAMQTIYRRSKGLLDFVENYRKLTRIPSPVMRFFSVLDLFKEIEVLCPMEPVYFTVSVKQEGLQLYADRSMVEQVLINLLKNAAEACKGIEESSVSLTADCRNGAVVITVADNGAGILPDVLERVFVPFFTTKQGGSGIGLSICRQIMNRHGGTISVTPNEGGGTVFTLQFGRQVSPSDHSKGSL